MVYYQGNTATQINKQLAGIFKVKAVDDLVLCS